MSVIYKISCKDLNVKECYFGSTKNFNKRKSNHKSDWNNENRKVYNSPIYKFIRNNGGWENWSMNVIEELDTTDKEIYKKCEAKYIRDNIDIVLNKEIPGRTIKEYCQDNKEKESLRHKIYYENNKEKESERKKKYYENNKEKISEKTKIYRENNKEKINKRHKIYQQNNKDELNRKRRERYQNKKNDSK